MQHWRHVIKNCRVSISSVFFSLLLHLQIENMAKKGPNDKKEAGNAKKAAAKAEKDNKKAAANAAVEDEKWAQGAKGKNKKLEDAEAKKVQLKGG